MVTLRSLETDRWGVCVGMQVRKWKGSKAAAEMLAGFRPEGSGEKGISRRVNLGSGVRKRSLWEGAERYPLQAGEAVAGTLSSRLGERVGLGAVG